MTMVAKLQEVVPAQTAAVTDLAVLNTKYYGHVVVFQDGLAGAEEVDVYVVTLDEDNAVDKQALAVDLQGDVVKLTVAAPTAVLPGGPIYGFAKDASVGAGGVYAYLSLGTKRR